MAELTNVRGLKELQDYLDKVPAKVEGNVMRSALRAGMKVVLPVAKSNIDSRSGELAAGLKIGTRLKFGSAVAYIKTGGKHGFVGVFLEFGTKAHFIFPKDSSSLSFAGLFLASVAHPGTDPEPFMRPALDTMARQAVIAAANHMKKRLAKKEGLDTKHIRIEGDE